MNNKNIKGIWLYGLSGVGKTYISKLIFKKRKDSIIIDGDHVRKYISSDLTYSKKDREIQCSRVLGIAKIAILSNLYPIMSTVWMSPAILRKSKKLGVEIIKIERNVSEVLKKKSTYKNKKNVVGVNFFYPKFKTKKIFNTEDKSFWKVLQKKIGTIMIVVVV